MPDYHTVDLGASVDVTQRLNIQANVNNLFDSFGIEGWARGGGVIAALNVEALTAADIAANPNQVLSIVPNLRRAYFLTATYRF